MNKAVTAAAATVVDDAVVNAGAVDTGVYTSVHNSVDTVVICTVIDTMIDTMIDTVIVVDTDGFVCTDGVMSVVGGRRS